MQINPNELSDDYVTSVADEHYAEIDLGEPVSREDVIRDPTKRFTYLLQRFYRGATMKTKKNDAMVRLYLHAILGAYFKNCVVSKSAGNTDTRVPLIWVQNSGSGKSQLNKFAVDISNRLGIKTTTETKFTEAGLVGTFDKTKHEKNIKNGVDNFNTTVETPKSTKVYSSPATPGDLYTFDLIFVDEGKILFQQNTYTEGLLSVLQPALDYPGKVRKKLSGSTPIEYDCTATIITTTVEFKELGSDLLLQGFFQRCLFMERKLNIDKYGEMLMECGNVAFDGEAYDQVIDDFVWAFEQHPIPLKRDRRNIYADMGVMRRSTEISFSWIGRIKELLYGKDMDVAQTFVSRMNMFLFKIAAQLAIVNNRVSPHSKVKDAPDFIMTVDDIDYAAVVVNEVMTSVLDRLSRGVMKQGQSMETFMPEILKLYTESKRKMTKERLIVFLMQRQHIGQVKAKGLYQEFVRLNYLTEQRIGNAIFVHPNINYWKMSDSPELHNTMMDDGERLLED